MMTVDRDWLTRHVQVGVKVEDEEDIDWRYHLEGDDSYKWIEAQLAEGNVWAWCTVTIKVTYGGFEVGDSIGGCSYENEASFRKDGYYNDLVAGCVDSIANMIEALAATHGLWMHDNGTCLVCIAE